MSNITLEKHNGVIVLRDDLLPGGMYMDKKINKINNGKT